MGGKWALISEAGEAPWKAIRPLFGAKVSVKGAKAPVKGLPGAHFEFIWRPSRIHFRARLRLQSTIPSLPYEVHLIHAALT